MKKKIAVILTMIFVFGNLTFSQLFLNVNAEASERVYYYNDFSAPENLEKLVYHNCVTPTISTSDDGLSVLRLENTKGTNSNASGIFYLAGSSKNSYIGINDAPVLIFEFRVRINSKCSSYDYFTTFNQSEFTGCITKSTLLTTANVSHVLANNVDRAAWNTVTTVFSNTDGSRKVYLNGVLAAEINEDHPGYAQSIYSKSGYKQFKPHFVAYMKNLGDFCEVDYVKLYTMSDSINVERAFTYGDSYEVYVDFDSSLLNISKEMFSIAGNTVLNAEISDRGENIVKLTLENKLEYFEKYTVSVKGIKNTGGGICNEEYTFTPSYCWSSTPEIIQKGVPVAEYEYSEEPVSAKATVKNFHNEEKPFTIYFSAYGYKPGATEKSLLLTKAETVFVPSGAEKEISTEDVTLPSGVDEIKAFVWGNLNPVSLVATADKEGFTSSTNGMPSFGSGEEIGNVSFSKKAGAASTGYTVDGLRTFIAMIGTPGYVFEFDTYTGEFLNSYQSGSGLQHAIKVGSDGKVYTMITGSPDLYVYDPATGVNELIQADCCQGSSVWSMNYGADDDRSMLYMPVMSSDYTNLGTSVVEYDIDNKKVTAYDGFDIGCKYAHAATGDEDYVYVGSADSNEVATVSRMDKKTGEMVVYEDEKGRTPGGVAFLKVVGDYIFTRFSSSIVVIDKYTMEKVDEFEGGRGQGNCISDPDPENPDLVYYNTNGGNKLNSYNLKTHEHIQVINTPTTYGNIVRYDFGRWFPDKNGVMGIAGVGGREDYPGFFHLVPSTQGFAHVYSELEKNNLGIPTKPHVFYLTRDDILYTGGYEAGLNGFDLKTNKLLFTVENGNQHGMTMVAGKLFGGSYGKDGMYMYDPQKAVSGSNPKKVGSTPGVNRYYYTTDTNAGFGLSVGIADYGNPEGGVILVTYLNGAPKMKIYLGVIPGENIIGVEYKDGYIYASSSIRIPQHEDEQHEEAHVAKIDAKTGETVLMTTVNFEGLPKTTQIGEIRFGPDGLLYGVSNAGWTVFALDPDDLSLVKYTTVLPDEYPAAGVSAAFMNLGSEGIFYATLSNDLYRINPETMEVKKLYGSVSNFCLDNDGNILKRQGTNSLLRAYVDKRQRLEIMIENAEKYYKKEEYSEESWGNFSTALNEAKAIDIATAYLPDVASAARKLSFAIKDLQTVYDYNAGFAYPFK